MNCVKVRQRAAGRTAPEFRVLHLICRPFFGPRRDGLTEALGERMQRAIGSLIREARSSRHCSLAELAVKSGVHRSTLSRWESHATEPRLPELNAVLNALDLPSDQRDLFFGSLRAPRGVRQVKTEAAEIRGLEDAHPPAMGDLFRALRRRVKLSLRAAASALGIHPSTLSRWEQTLLIPGEEDRERLFALYRALPEERKALTRGSWLTAQYCEPPNTREALLYRLQYLSGLSWTSPHPLLDLNFYSLEASCWSLLKQAPWARHVLAQVYTWHGVGLYWQHRYGEARKVGYQALALSADLPPDNTWIWSAAYVARASSALRAGSTSGNEARFLSQYTAMAHHLGVIQILDEALFDCRIETKSGGEALSIAEKLIAERSRMKIDYWTSRSMSWRMAKALIQAGQPDRALTFMPMDEQPNLHQQMEEKLTWVELLLALGERSGAEQRYVEALALMQETGMEFPRADRLGRLL